MNNGILLMKENYLQSIKLLNFKQLVYEEIYIICVYLLIVFLY